MVGSTGIDFLHHLDQNCTLFINRMSWWWSDGFWMMMSDKTVWAPMYVIVCYFLFRRLGWKKALIVLASVGVSFALCDQFSNLVKNAVLRLRPSYSSWMLRHGITILEKRGSFYGFFSAHAANAFAIAVCLIIGFRNDHKHTYNAFYRWAMWWAVLVSASRIFVGKHYFGDVLVGAVVGIVIGYFVGMLTRYLIQKYVDKVPVTGLTMKFDKKRLPTILARFSPSGSLSNPSQGR